jgi:hypothetical protein
MTRGFGRFLRHNTIALLALFVALGGTSFAAATLLNGSQIKPHTIAKNRLTNKAIKQLKGNRGPQGPPGAQGAQGAQGIQGIQGPAGPFPNGNLPGGNTLRGNWMALCDTNEPTCWTDIAFGYQMASPLVAHYIPAGAAASAACPGSADNPLAAAGHLCVYESIEGNTDHTDPNDYIYDQDFNGNQSGRWGAEIRILRAAAGYYYALGTWAATSPASASAASHASHASPHSVITGK